MAGGMSRRPFAILRTLFDLRAVRKFQSRRGARAKRTQARAALHATNAAVSGLDAAALRAIEVVFAAFAGGSARTALPFDTAEPFAAAVFATFERLAGSGERALPFDAALRFTAVGAREAFLTELGGVPAPMSQEQAALAAGRMFAL